MNVDNIKYAIEVMKKAESLSMTCFQSGEVDVESVEELHTCGNTACFIGYLVLTPLWEDFFKNMLGGNYYFSRDGSYYNCNNCDLESEYSLSEFLGIDETLAYDLIFGDTDYYYGDGEEYPTEYSEFYDTPWSEVKPEHVIAKLELILSGELV